jgi:hypothetical protein
MKQIFFALILLGLFSCTDKPFSPPLDRGNKIIGYDEINNVTVYRYWYTTSSKTDSFCFYEIDNWLKKGDVVYIDKVLKSVDENRKTKK